MTARGGASAVGRRSARVAERAVALTGRSFRQEGGRRPIGSAGLLHLLCVTDLCDLDDGG